MPTRAPAKPPSFRGRVRSRGFLPLCSDPAAVRDGACNTADPCGRAAELVTTAAIARALSELREGLGRGEQRRGHPRPYGACAGGPVRERRLAPVRPVVQPRLHVPLDMKARSLKQTVAAALEAGRVDRVLARGEDEDGCAVRGVPPVLGHCDGVDQA